MNKNRHTIVTISMNEAKRWEWKYRRPNTRQEDQDGLTEEVILGQKQNDAKEQPCRILHRKTIQSNE